MSPVTMPCEHCGLAVVVAAHADGRTEVFETFEHAVRLDGGRVIPMANIYVPHTDRCLGETVPVEDGGS